MSYGWLVQHSICSSGFLLRPTFLHSSTSPGRVVLFVPSGASTDPRLQGLNRLTGLFNPFFLSPLLLALCYTATQDQRGMKSQLFFISIPSQLMPYAIMFIDLLNGGPFALFLDLHGLFAAHLYDFLSRIWPEFGGGRNLIPTPTILSRLVKTPRVMQRSFGTAIQSNDPPASRSTGASRGPLPDSWQTRGPGRRLG